MELIASTLRVINQLLLAVALAMAPLLAMSPSTVGHWLAQMDIAYDSVWIEYVSDCDCTPTLE